MVVRRAQTELEARPGHFRKRYASTFDCATIYGQRMSEKKMAHEKVDRPPLEPDAQITVLNVEIT